MGARRARPPVRPPPPPRSAPALRGGASRAAGSPCPALPRRLLCPFGFAFPNTVPEEGGRPRLRCGLSRQGASRLPSERLPPGARAPRRVTAPRAQRLRSAGAPGRPGPLLAGGGGGGAAGFDALPRRRCPRASPSAAGVRV